MLINRGLAMLSGIIYARYLGPENFGLFSFAVAIISMATLPVVAGIPNLLIREISHFHLDAKWSLLAGVIRWSLIYVLVLSIIIVACMYLGLHFNFFNVSVSNLLWCATLLIPLKGVLTHQSAVLNGFKSPLLAQLPIQIFTPAFTLILLFFYINTGIDLNASRLIDISLLASFFAFIISAVIVKRIIKLDTKKIVREYNIKNWHASLLPFTVMTFAATLNLELASVLIGWLVDNESVAYFKVAMQAVALIALGLHAVNAVIMPNVAQLHKKEDLEGTQALLTKSVRLSALVSLPLIFFLMIYGDFAIDLLFGEDYLEAYPILVILCFGQLVNVLVGSVGIVLNMTGNEKSALKSISITLVLNLFLLAILIPLYGGIGAAIAVSVSLICWNVLMVFDVYRLTQLKTWLKFS
jgi:O-antigen/teichoic acid export membrane protein